MMLTEGLFSYLWENPYENNCNSYLVQGDRTILFTGDVVFYGGIGRTDFTEGNPKLLLQSIQRLSQLDIELLLPGHGEIVMGRDRVLQNFESVRQNFYSYL